MFHHQLFKQPPRCTRPFLSTPCLEPSLSPFCLTIVYHLVLLLRPSGNAHILTDLPCILYCIVLLQCLSDNIHIIIGSLCNLALPCALMVPLWQHSQSHRQANPPLHSHAVVIIIDGLRLSPYSLGLPPIAPFVVVIGLPSSPYSLGMPTCLNIK